MIKQAPTGTYCNDCKAEYGNFDTKTRTWTFNDKCVPIAVIIAISETKRAKGAERAYCVYHKAQAEKWPDGNGGYITWPLQDQIQEAVEAEKRAASV